MTPDKDYLGEKLRLVERAQEDAYFRRLDQELIAKMRQEAAQATEEAAADVRLDSVFTPILVPVDFSPYATQALLATADIAERFGSSIIVLHVIAREVGIYALQRYLGQDSTAIPGTAPAAAPQDMSSEEVSTVIQAQREQAYAELQAFLPARLATSSLELRVVVGRPYERIVETAAQDHVGLIVMGTHGRTGISRIAMGSVAERVLRLAPCPVLTVKVSTPESESWLKDFYASFMRS